MPNYENETCKGCRFFREHPTECEITCVHQDDPGGGWPDRADHCDQFAPSLECRQVRALERLAGCEYEGHLDVRTWEQ